MRWLLTLSLLCLLTFCSAANAAEPVVTATPDTVAPGAQYTFSVGISVDPWRVIENVAIVTFSDRPPWTSNVVSVNVGEPLSGVAISVPIPEGTAFVEATATDQAGAQEPIMSISAEGVVKAFGDVLPGQSVMLAVVLAVL